MSSLVLHIGDKELSSWSLRPWLVMKMAGIGFEERIVRLDRPETKAAIGAVSPSSKVPCLVDGDLVVWDSLAICEYLAEQSDEPLWPEERGARAVARAAAAEMHSGFQALRTKWPMQFSKESLRRSTEGVEGDIARIAEIWETCRRDFGDAGPFLFGRFSIADAMYAPVVSRFVTYGPVDLPPLAAKWRDHMRALPAMREWGDGARAELG